jgi:opacity protein-like surface antigen
MKRILFCLLTLMPLSMIAQHFEAGLMVGASNYIGDLARNSRKVYLKETRPALGLFARYNLNDYVALRVSGNYASISGADSNADDQKIVQRNLSFRSNLIEFGVTGEFNLSGFQPYGLSRVFSPYLFVGIGATMFNPQAKYEGEWVDLQPLGTEGQGLSQYPERQAYNRTVMSIPFGIGFKYALTDQWNLGIEFGARRTSTDYLDDVSGTYVEFSELLAGSGELAAALGNRTGELSGGDPVSVPTGTVRGDDARNDWYVSTRPTPSHLTTIEVYFYE